jgi:predicted O-methyltransferase YrrM
MSMSRSETLPAASDVGQAAMAARDGLKAAESSGSPQPLSSEELARPLIPNLAPEEIDVGDPELRDLIAGQEARLEDLERQLADAERELGALRLQRSGQEARAAQLQRQHEQAAAELVRRRSWLSKLESRAVKLERWAQGRSPRVASGLALVDRVASRLILLKWSVKTLVKSALKTVAVPLLTGRAFQRRRQDKLVFTFGDAPSELRRNAQEAIAETESLLRHLDDERVEQSSRVDHLTRLVVEQEAVVGLIGRELAQQPARIEELKRELVPDERFEGQPLVRLARSYRRDSWWPELQSLRSISMLHFETLYLLRSLAMRTTDAVVEVGPYIGGSTIALGRGLQMGGGGPLISIEMGGSYPNHAVPTNDIIADLKRNVEAYGLTGLAHIMEGFSTDPAIEAAVDRILAGKPIGLLFLDADGDVARDFELYRSRLSRGSILVFDDFISEHAPEKQTTIKIWVDQAVASGLVENLGVYRWGTWVGRYWG